MGFGDSICSSNQAWCEQAEETKNNCVNKKENAGCEEVAQPKVDLSGRRKYRSTPKAPKNAQNKHA
jgi:hypothetical protein